MIAHGSVLSARGAILEVRLPGASIGDGVRIVSKAGGVRGTVHALSAARVLVVVHDGIDGIARGDEAMLDSLASCMPLGMPLVGRCIDARGNALDDGPPLRGRTQSIRLNAPTPAEREAVSRPFWSGIRAIDALLTLGRGARIGIFGRPGTGKSTLLQMLLQNASADAVVVGLIGERGREAEEWVRVAPCHASVVCATSDRSAAERIWAARVAVAQAASLRARGLHVLLILDSLARYAASLREVSIATGEPVGRGGYPPSVYADLARYVEVAGNAQGGSITLVATVLSEDDERDPVSDAARSLLDGHIQLSPDLAQRGRFPAIAIPASVSRTMHVVVDPTHAERAALVRRAVCVLSESEQARALGIVPADPFALRAIALEEALDAFLRQSSPAEHPRRTLSALADLADRLR